MEICLGSDGIDAETLEAWGYLSRVFDSARDLDRFVHNLAQRIAAWPAEAIALCKQSILNAEPDPVPGMLEEAHLFQQTLGTAGAQTNMRKAMEMELQTRGGELRMGELCLEIATAANADG